MTFEVLTSKLHGFEKQMARLARKAGKLGVAAPAYTVGEARYVERRDEHDRKYMVEIVPVEVTPVVVKIPGWEFLATLEHLEGGETLLRALVEGVPAEYRIAPPWCDHCRLERKRNDTYLVRSETTGEVKQVGRSCIADFLGHDNPEHLAALAEYAAAVNGADEDGWGEGTGGEPVAEVLTFLSVATSLARLEGYKSRKMVSEDKASMTTAATVMEVLFPVGNHWKKEAPKVLAAVTEDDRATAQASLDWILGLEGEVNDFLHNVRAVVRTGGVRGRTAGYAAALTVAYAREMGRLKERAERPESHHVGTVGEREVFTLTVGKVVPLETAWGMSYLYLMTDAAGNDFKWFGSNANLGKVGETVTIKGTVKAHEEYKGRKQTQLTRCAAYVEKPKKVRVKKVTVAA